MSYDQDYGIYTAHPSDPRTPELPCRELWEEENGPTDYMDLSEIEEILCELLHGDPAKAKADLEVAVACQYRVAMVRAQREAEANRYLDREAA